jgi:6-carboxyhexanoate--CoA ligase
MMSNNLTSIRMRASLSEEHVSGAERLVPKDRIDTTVSELIRRAQGRENRPDRIILTIEDIGSAVIKQLRSLDLVTLNVSAVEEARRTAARVLERAGVFPIAAERAMKLLAKGPAPAGRNMRGAMMIDAMTGGRAEPDPERGVRTSRFDWSDQAKAAVEQQLSLLGLTHFRTREALALATKVAHAPGILSELCWSDDPDYTAGYVSSRSFGYVRFPFLKKRGMDRGGRAFFVRHEGFDREACIRYLEQEVVLITGPGTCRPAEDTETFYRTIPAR